MTHIRKKCPQKWLGLVLQTMPFHTDFSPVISRNWPEERKFLELVPFVRNWTGTSSFSKERGTERQLGWSSVPFAVPFFFSMSSHKNPAIVTLPFHFAQVTYVLKLVNEMSIFFLHCGTYNFGLFSQRVWQVKVKLGTGAEEGSNTPTGKLHTDRDCQESGSLVDSGSVLFWDCYSLLLLSKKEGAGVRTCSNKNWKTTKLASKQSNLM